VSDEFKLQRDVDLASRADRLLNDDLLRQAFAELKDQYTKTLLNTTEDQGAARERMYLAYRVVGEVERHLTNIISNGKVSKAELDQLAQLAERKKRFGLI
jgi:hypothetical protein